MEKLGRRNDPDQRAADRPERRAKHDPALDQALQPLLAIAVKLPKHRQAQALIGYVTVKIHMARWRPR